MRLRIPAVVPMGKIGNFPKLVPMANSDDVVINGIEHFAGTLQFLGFSSKRDGQVYKGTYIFEEASIPFLEESEMFSFADNLPGLVKKPVKLEIPKTIMPRNEEAKP